MTVAGYFSGDVRGDAQADAMLDAAQPPEGFRDCPTCRGVSTVDPDPDCPTCGGEGCIP